MESDRAWSFLNCGKSGFGDAADLGHGINTECYRNGLIVVGRSGMSNLFSATSQEACCAV